MAEGDPLQRLTGEPFAKQRRPGDVEADVGGSKRRRRRIQPRGPGAVRTQARPAGAAQGQNHGAGPFQPLAVRRLERQRSVPPSDPARAGADINPQRLQPRQPGAQKGRRLHRLGEDPPAGAHEGRLAQPLDPLRQVGRREGVDPAGDGRPGGAGAGREVLQRLGMGQVQPAASGHQELARHRRHPVVDHDAQPRLGQPFGRHQPGRPGADHMNLSDGFAHRPALPGRLGSGYRRGRRYVPYHERRLHPRRRS